MDGREGFDSTLEDDEQPDAWLDRLSADARLIWSDADARASALGDIARAWRQADPSLDELVNRVDAAVVEGLAALGFPRGPVRSVIVRDAALGMMGQKRADCTLILFGPALEEVMIEAAPDRFFSTWVHESLHARQPFAQKAGDEYRQYRGFEEGLVQGLTRHILGLVGITRFQGPFRYYVATYEQLAGVIGIQAIELWQRLWTNPAGSVSHRFVDVVNMIIREENGAQLSHRQMRLLFAVAAGLFRTSQDRDGFDEIEIRHQWEAVFDERKRIY